MAAADSKEDTTEEITDISITPAENGCTVRVSTKKKSKKKTYDGFEYNNRTYVADASLLKLIKDNIGAEVADGSDDDKPETKFNSKDFK